MAITVFDFDHLRNFVALSKQDNLLQDKKTFDWPDFFTG